MKISDLNKITVDDLLGIPTNILQNFQITLNDAIAKQKQQDRNDFLKKVKALADESGVILDEFLLSPSKKIPNPIRYRNPDDLSQGWTGRGRKPNWLLALIDSGHALEKFEV